MAADGGGVIVQADPRTCRSAAADGAARRASARRTVLFFSLHVPFVGTLVHHRSPFPPNYPSLGCLAAEGRRGRGSLSALVVTSCAARPRQSMAAPSLSRSLPPPLPPPPFPHSSHPTRGTLRSRPPRNSLSGAVTRHCHTTAVTATPPRHPGTPLLTRTPAAAGGVYRRPWATAGARGVVVGEAVPSSARWRTRSTSAWSSETAETARDGRKE